MLALVRSQPEPPTAFGPAEATYTRTAGGAGTELPFARLFGGRGKWQRADEHLAAADAAAGEAGTIEAVVTTRVARAAVARAATIRSRS